MSDDSRYVETRWRDLGLEGRMADSGIWRRVRFIDAECNEMSYEQVGIHNLNRSWLRHVSDLPDWPLVPRETRWEELDLQGKCESGWCKVVRIDRDASVVTLKAGDKEVHCQLDHTDLRYRKPEPEEPEKRPSTVGDKAEKFLADVGEADRVVKVFRAEPIADDKVPTVALLMTEDMPPRVQKAHHRQNAQDIADALWSCLPGGTLDALLTEMLDRRRSSLIVRQEDVS